MDTTKEPSEPYKQGYNYGKRFRQRYPDDTERRSYRMAGAYAMAYLRIDNSPNARHQFIRGFLEGCGSAPR